MNRFIIADATKCIGCRTCEVACVVSHQENQDCASLTPETFLPRIHVIKGVNISTATVCRESGLRCVVTRRVYFPYSCH